MVYQAARRIAQPDAAHEGLVFGRLDLREEVDPEPRYIGRIGLRDANRDSLLIDWRPAAAVFYQATAAEPHDVVRRRVLRSRDRPSSGSRTSCSTRRPRPAADRRRGRADGAALRARDRSMHSDRRHHPGRAGQGDPGSRQGGRRDLRRPGTARPWWPCTAPRSCFSTDRRRYESGGVLIIGPSGVFMRYIERVLLSSARPRSRCGRWARSSRASARPGTTSRLSPT